INQSDLAEVVARTEVGQVDAFARDRGFPGFDDEEGGGAGALHDDGLTLGEGAQLEQAGDLLGLPAVHISEELDALQGGNGGARMAVRLRPAWRSRTWRERSRRKWSGTTRPATTASPRPQLASIKRSSAPVTGFSVNMTPAAVGLRSVWTTTPTLGRVNLPTRWR